MRPSFQIPPIKPDGVLALFAAAALVVCACDTDDAGLDAGAHRDSGTGDAIQPPDISATDGTGTGNIGRPCTPNAAKTGCTGKAVCLALSKTVGICAVPDCKMEDIRTAEVEDTCPSITPPGGGAKAATACTTISSLKRNFCLPRCKPDPKSNPCTKFHKELSCDPVSLLYNGHTAVCLFPRCDKDYDCGNKNPLSPDSTCHKATGTCLARGKTGAKVGDPCKVDNDCGKAQNCYPEQKNSAGKKVVEDGYCTVVGCALGDPWACPAGSKCFSMGPAGALSLCLATGCSVSKPESQDGCRDKATAGQYDCYYISKTPVCWIKP